MSNLSASSTTPSRIVITMAAIVIVIAGLKEAAPIIIPFLLSLFVAVVCAPPVRWVEQHGVPKLLAVTIVAIAILVVNGLLVGFVGSSVNDFYKALPTYQERLTSEAEALITWLGQQGIALSKDTVLEHFDPGVAMRMVGNFFTGLGGVLANTFLITLTVIFMLLEAASLPDKVHRAFGSGKATLENFGKIAVGVQNYLALKAVISFATGIIIAIVLWLLGVDNALLWGLVAFMLNFIPNIGSIIAAVPAVLLTYIDLGGGYALAVIALYATVNIVMGNVIEPRVMGRGVGLSTLVVFLSLVFWGWVFGPVGMLLSVPLTMVLKIALESNQDMRWLAIMLGSESPPEDTPSDETQA